MCDWALGPPPALSLCVRGYLSEALPATCQRLSLAVCGSGRMAVTWERGPFVEIRWGMIHLTQTKPERLQVSHRNPNLAGMP
jgi:hypothetical protein